MRLPFIAAILVLAGTSAAAAAELPPELLKCAGIARDADRLACYDAAVSSTSGEARAIAERRAAESARIAAEEKAAADARAKAEAERLAAEKARRKKEDFGAEAIASRAPEVRKEREKDEIQSVEGTITEVLTSSSGTGVFVLDNGQIWRQIDTQGVPRVKNGDKARVERTALGGYNMVFDRLHRRVLVKRMR